MIARHDAAKLRRRLLAAVIAVAAAIAAWSASRTPDGVDEAFAGKRSGVMLTVEGTVRRVLSDDREGSAHQRFILETGGGRTVLVAHNIDLAPRVPELSEGSPITVRGQYEWNDKGGVLHWTHHDPDGRREGGWILHNGERYE